MEMEAAGTIFIRDALKMKKLSAKKKACCRTGTRTFLMAHVGLDRI